MLLSVPDIYNNIDSIAYPIFYYLLSNIYPIKSSFTKYILQYTTLVISLMQIAIDGRKKDVTKMGGSDKDATKTHSIFLCIFVVSNCYTVDTSQILSSVEVIVGF